TTAYGKYFFCCIKTTHPVTSQSKHAKLLELKFELLSHPPYSPDLAPSDYWLFADLKKMLA
ncbi:Histone-lysine N-methyltransferase SETMAR, partial [Caligus rogercresseyi]